MQKGGIIVCLRCALTSEWFWVSVGAESWRACCKIRRALFLSYLQVRTHASSKQLTWVPWLPQTGLPLLPQEKQRMHEAGQPPSAHRWLYDELKGCVTASASPGVAGQPHCACRWWHGELRGCVFCMKMAVQTCQHNGQGAASTKPKQ